MFINCVQEERPTSLDGKSERITLKSSWNVTHLVIKGQMVASTSQGMLREVHIHKDSLTRCAADGIC